MIPNLEITEIEPVVCKRTGSGTNLFADFGADAYGNLRIIMPPQYPKTTLTVHLGEKLDATGVIDRKPYGSINYRKLTVATKPEQMVYQLPIPSKPRHNNPNAVHTPPEIGEITVFRYAEIEKAPQELNKDSLRQLWVHTAFDNNASMFESSDETLNRVWKLCKHTMKATTAFGVYIDGERERIPYEADAYINQLSHLACDANPEVAQYTVEHLLKFPTWPTEWSFHVPMMAATDFMFTGNPSLAEKNYEALKKKLLMEKAREDGLIRAKGIIDWPSGERDGYNGINSGSADTQIGPEINTVVNAFYYHALKCMKIVSDAIGRKADSHDFETKAANVYNNFNKSFFDHKRGVYIDGEGSDHASLHANMLPLAFDLVPERYSSSVADFVQTRGMACSVYGAQYLLEALFKARREEYAFELMTSHSDRGWWHMMELGSTMTLEAWDAKYKPNLTWNHAWGAAPANIVSRYVLGVRPLQPGFKDMTIAPQPGSLASVHGLVPTVAGPVTVNYHFDLLEVEIPKNTTAQLVVPKGHKIRDFVSQAPSHDAVSELLSRDSIVIRNIQPGKTSIRLTKIGTE